ncbi:MAG TPA: DUF4376 domain-containing protein [Bosea sp. (in: a-proteobacteria)]|jgi:hypothetical protein|uniref:DUF4376 domain-containing protein n=1 Tax=Bosea sp. (in: a-proteobacteria) TaxID=1871050 RepID=UPI002DDD63B4|nr:DUF4376 domain-containing protein [Bosea sp. (in: a-proteobacteria)]HEV2556796.1 DUF4376 domain-containing protein [Bosea sp. (in: a-proteobacteria)]
MQRFARIADGVVVEIMSSPDGEDFAELFHPEIVAACRPCGAEVTQGWLLKAGELVAPPPPAPPTRAELITRLKNQRWQREIAGVTAMIGGQPVLVSTARGDERATLHATLTAISLGLRSDGATYNFADGVPRAVSNADMQGAIMAALAHVQGAFDLELALTADIEAGEITAFADIDAAFAAA